MSVLAAANSQLIWRESVYQRQRISGGSKFLWGKPYHESDQLRRRRMQRQGKTRESSSVQQAASFLEDVFMLGGGEVMEMEEIKDCEQLDLILLQAKDLSQPILIDWMAAWCRKCIYLKPKLEKLAAEYDTKLKFYCVDVNSVPQALVKRGNISKMPTIQLWKDGEFKAEVIGGHKAWLVVDEVREMIQKFV